MLSMPHFYNISASQTQIRRLVCAAASGTNPEGTARTILFAAAIPRFRRGAKLDFAILTDVQVYL